MDKPDTAEDLRTGWSPDAPASSAAERHNAPGVGVHPPHAKHPDHRAADDGGHDGPAGRHDSAQQEHGSDQANLLPEDLPQIGTAKVLVGASAFVGLLIGLFVLGYVPYRERQAAARADAAAAGSAVPVVNVTHPKPESRSTDLLLPGDVQALQYTLIYPRTSGYLKRLLVDIGDRVEVNQLLAEIDTPEVDAQLDEARANVEQAKANLVKAQTDLALAKVTLDRYQSVADKRAVSQQDLDDKRAQYDQANASVDVAKATISSLQSEVQRLEVLQGFEKVIAPFGGTITARNYDLGALLSPISTGGAKELFQIARTDTLRVFVNVPQEHAARVQIGQTADLLVRNYPGRTFDGQVTRSAGAVNPATRTLRVEVDVANADNLLFAGMYGEVRFHITQAEPPLMVPSSALVYNADGLSVAVVQDGRVHFQKVAVAHDFGNELEISEGLSGGEAIVSNPGERLKEGLEVQVVSPRDDQHAALAKSYAGRP